MVSKMLICLAFILLVRWTQAVRPAELPAYVHFFDSEDEITADDDFDFKIVPEMHSALLEDSFPDTKQVTNNRNRFGFFELHNLGMTDLTIENKLNRSPTTSDKLILNKNKNDLKVMNELPVEMTSSIIDKMLQKNEKRTFYDDNGNIKPSNSDKTEEEHGIFTDFFAQIIKFCIESIGAIIDSIIGVPKIVTSTNKDKSLHEMDFFEDKSQTKNIKKRDLKNNDVGILSSITTDYKVLSNQITQTPSNDGMDVENIKLENQKELFVTSSEKTDSSMNETPTPNTDTSSSSIASSDTTTTSTTDDTNIEPQTHKLHDTINTLKTENPVLNDFLSTKEKIQAKEISGITSKVINGQELNDMSEDELNSKLSFQPFQEEIKEEISWTRSLFTIGGTLMVVAILALVGTAAAYKFRQQQLGHPHSDNQRSAPQNPIMV